MLGRVYPYQWNEDIELYRDQILESLKNVIDETREESLRLSFFRGMDEQLKWHCHSQVVNRDNQSLSLKVVEHPCQPTNRPSWMKMAQYGDVLRDKRKAQKQGYHDLLLLDEQGRVLETSMGNIIGFDGRKYFIPFYERGMLAGITRKKFIELVSVQGREVEEGPFYWSEFQKLPYFFRTSSIQGVVPVEKIDDKSYDIDYSYFVEVKNAWREKVLKEAIKL